MGELPTPPDADEANAATSFDCAATSYEPQGYHHGGLKNEIPDMPASCNFWLSDNTHRSFCEGAQRECSPLGL